ncbi:MAG: dUTPase [Tenericutes bacterium ADurb.Bin087]|nr:MAG: dUTPase [Tenericutes bacterium ADurb.Bin087]
MEINLAPLLAKQQELDADINARHNVTHQSTKTERFLALLVEVSELANATRAFKYWSLKPSESREVLLDEYADGLHFFLSLALVFNFPVEKVKYAPLPATKEALNAAFKRVYLRINDLMRRESNRCYNTALRAFLRLGSALEFTPQDIINAYNAKLVVNYERQQKNY